jgi:hypothetical protein
MDFGVIAATGDFGAQGATPFERAQHLALQGIGGGEWILPGPERTEWLLKAGDHGYLCLPSDWNSCCAVVLWPAGVM